MIGTKLSVTVGAKIRFTRLSGITQPTDNFRNRKAIDFMMSFFALEPQGQGSSFELPLFAAFHRIRPIDAILDGPTYWFSLAKGHGEDGTFVVTNPTSKGHSATGTNDGTVPLVVRTRRSGFFHSPVDIDGVIPNRVAAGGGRHCRSPCASIGPSR